MKKNKNQTKSEMSLLKSVAIFIFTQFVMISMSIFFAAGGDGTGIPITIFYGPLLIFFQFEIFENALISFSGLLLILTVLFITIYNNFLNKKNLLKVAILYNITAIILLIYLEISGNALGSNISLKIKVLAFTLSAMTSLLFWKALFLIAKNVSTQKS